MQKTFQVISDPGHAWCKVPFSVLAELRIVDAITYYSYVRKGFAYLEEDCDLSAFVAAYREETGVSPIFKESTADKYSRVRGYEVYTTTRAAEWALKELLNKALAKKLNSNQKMTCRYLTNLLPEDHITKVFLKEYLEAESRLEIVHVGG